VKRRQHKDDGTPISPQYFSDIELRRVPAPHVLHELARVFELDHDPLLALAGAADVVVLEHLKAHPQHTRAIIKPLRTAQQGGFPGWDHLRQLIERGSRAGG
jgi:hypothetical protein